MQTGKTLSQIFQEVPPFWGLRGDPFLWEELKNALGNLAYPDTEEEFNSLLEKTYEQITGRTIRDLQSVFIERFSHGGMSSGQVSPVFWIETGFPMLREQYRQTR